MRLNKVMQLVCAFAVSTGTLAAQHMKMGEVLFISNSEVKKDAKSFQQFLQQVNPTLEKKNSKAYLFQADRGDRKGESLLVCSMQKEKDRKGLSKNPFTDKVFSAGGNSLANFINPDRYTEYHLIGGKEFPKLPAIDLLGIHYIKVKPERAAEFDQFVVEKLHPAVGHLLPDMQLLYYKATAGDNAGSYITIFAIQSTTARHRYWPEGEPETELVKEAFAPLNDLAKELSDYLVEGSYLLPESGGGAAYFESREWTDFVVIN